MSRRSNKGPGNRAERGGFGYWLHATLIVTMPCIHHALWWHHVESFIQLLAALAVRFL